MALLGLHQDAILETPKFIDSISLARTQKRRVQVVATVLKAQRWLASAEEPDTERIRRQKEAGIATGPTIVAESSEEG